MALFVHPAYSSLRRLPRRLGICLALLAVTAAPLSASAEEPPSPARQLFLDARKLAQEGKHTEACPKFEESLRLEVGVGTQFNLADCWEHIGRTASARALFLGAAASAKATGQVEREQVLRERAAALEPRLTRVVVEVQSTAPKLSVRRNDLPLEPDQFGTAVAMDPGKYVISARAPGKKPWQKSIEVAAGTALVTVVVPELEAEALATPVTAAPPPKVAPKLSAAKPMVQHSAASSQPTSDRGGKINYPAVAVGGIGVGALALGAIMGVRYKSANNDAKEICPSNRGCSVKEIQDHDKFVDEARTARTWSYVGFGVGAVGLAGAAALWIFNPPRTTATLQAVPVVAADGSLGATLLGRF